MPSRDEILSIFNSRLIDFLRECTCVFPGDVMFSTYPMLAEATIAADPAAIVTVLAQRVFGPYGDRIDARDEAFFLEDDTVVANEEPAVRMVIGTLRGKWSELDLDARASMWAWLAQLKKIAAKVAV